jgi:hypothetical protein
MKKCILTCLNRDKVYLEIAKTTLPLIKQYAEYCGADFLLHESDRESETITNIKFDAYSKFESYDECVFIDLDVIVKKQESLFENFSHGKFCALDIMPYMYHCKAWWSSYKFLETCEKEGEIYKIRDFVFNAGVFTISGDLLYLLKPPNSYGEESILYEEALLNIRVQNAKCFNELDMKWNCIPFLPTFTKVVNTANFIHIAGINKLRNMRKYAGGC